MLKHVLQYTARYPHYCCFCHQKSDTSYDLCRFCQSQLPTILTDDGSNQGTSVCLYCGIALQQAGNTGKCVQCAKIRSPWSKIICPYRYEFPVDKLIQRLKYHHHLPTGRLLGSLLAHEKNQIQFENQPDLLVPVPAEHKRYRQRGFNQAGEIAKWCGRASSVQVVSRGVGRHTGSVSLVGLSRAERELAIRGSFFVDERVYGQRVAIVDDVLTTGATAGELATELLDTGAADVQLWVVARTLAGDRV